MHTTQRCICILVTLRDHSTWNLFLLLQIFCKCYINTHTWINTLLRESLPRRLNSREIPSTSHLLKIPLSLWLEMTLIAASDLFAGVCVSVCVWFKVLQGIHVMMHLCDGGNTVPLPTTTTSTIYTHRHKDNHTQMCTGHLYCLLSVLSP